MQFTNKTILYCVTVTWQHIPLFCGCSHAALYSLPTNNMTFTPDGAREGRRRCSKIQIGQTHCIIQVVLKPTDGFDA